MSSISSEFFFLDDANDLFRGFRLLQAIQKSGDLDEAADFGEGLDMGPGIADFGEEHQHHMDRLVVQGVEIHPVSDDSQGQRHILDAQDLAMGQRKVRGDSRRHLLLALDQGHDGGLPVRNDAIADEQLHHLLKQLLLRLSLDIQFDQCRFKDFRD